MKKYRLLTLILLISTSILAQTGTPDYTWYSGKVSPYSISSTDQLLALSNIVNGTADATINNGDADNFATKTINLTADLDLGNYNYPGGTSGWISIGNKSTNPFTGYFDGQNFTIKNLVSHYSTDHVMGLFGYVRNGKIRQLTLENVEIESGATPPINHIAGVVAYLDALSDSAIVENCSVTGTVRGTAYSENGGLVGCINSNGFVEVRNCKSFVTVLNGNSCGMIGHLIANSLVTIRNCINNGNVLCDNSQGIFGGGVIGLITNYYSKQCTISNCTNTGEVSNFGSGGGVIGYIDGGPINIDHCVNKAKIYNGNCTGGIIGFARGSFYINTSYNSGLISSTTYSGGIAGFIKSRCSITNSYNTGVILVSGSTGGTGGGIVGLIEATWYDSVAMKNCYNTGTIAGESTGDAGGIVGYGYVNNSGFISTSNCVSLGCSLSGYPTGAGRIMGGSDGDVTFNDNYGWLLTKVNGNTVSDSNKDGAGISIGQASIASNWWNGTTGYFTATENLTITPDQVWIFSNDQLPILKSILGQIDTWPVCSVYTVSYNTNGGSEITDEEVNKFGRATRPVNPTQTGYTFVDWYSDPSLNTVFDFNTLITEDITLYAKWAIVIYTVSFNTNGGSEIADEHVSMFDKALRPVNPIRPGYIFTDWYSDQSFNSVFDFNTIITNDITLYAKWEPIPIELNPDKISATYSCAVDNAVLTFGVKIGLPSEYKIIFGSKAINAGFTDIEYTAISSTDSTITIPVPSSAPEGSYTATLFIRGLAGNESSGNAFIITKLLSADIIVGKFTNLVLCDNSLNRFEKYQWYKNGIQITNADKQYYDDVAGRGGNSYQVRVVTSTGDTLMSCPKIFVKSQIAGVNLKIFPNPLVHGEVCTLELEGLASNEIEGSILTIYNSYGIAVFSTERITDSNKITIPGGIDGIYICELVTSSGTSYSCKIIMSK
jgi:uncharacterized repeat protein (TIGR02543 family)